MLSAEQVEHYREQGYVVARGLIERERLERWDRRFCDLITGRVKSPERLLVVKDVMVAKGAVVPESPLHAVNKIFAFEDDPVLFEHSRDERILDRVQELIGPEIMSITTNVINKPPGVDGRHPLHQDLTYFALRPADAIVGVWTAIGRATRVHGCLAVVPGSHRGPHLKHADPDWEWVNKYFFGAEGADVEARVHLEMEPGDTLFFHPLLLHGSGHNRTTEFRRAITTHFASAQCERSSPSGVSNEGFRRLR